MAARRHGRQHKPPGVVRQRDEAELRQLDLRPLEEIAGRGVVHGAENRSRLGRVGHGRPQRKDQTA